MAQTIVDLSFKADTSDLTKAQDNLKHTGEAAKTLDTQIKSAETNLKGFANQINSVTGALNPLKAGLAALGGALFLDKLVDMFKNVTEGAANIQKMHIQTGMAVEQLSIMNSVAKQSGTSMDTVVGAVVKFEKGLAAAGRETSIQAKAFKELGISTKDTSKTTEQYFDMAVTKLAGLREGWEKNNIVMALFGKTGTELNEFLADYANKGDITAKVLAEQAVQAEEYQRTMKRLSAMGTQLQQVFGLGLMPVIKGLSDEFLIMATKTGKLDAESKKLLMNDVEEWGWGAAKGVAAVVDVFGALWGTLRYVGEVLGITAAHFVGYGEVVSRVLSGDITGAFNAAKANELTYFEAMNEATTRLTKSYNTNAMAAVDASKAKRDATKNNPVEIDTRRKANNIGEDLKNGADTTDGRVAETVKQLDAIIKLSAETGKFYGVQEQTNEAMMIAAIESGKYNAIKVEGRTLTEKETIAYKEQLLQYAKAQDTLKNNIENIKEGIKQRKNQIEIESKMQKVNADDISARVMMQYGKTATDAAIAVGAYNLKLAEEELISKRVAGATKDEIDNLEQKIKVMQADQQANGQKKENEAALKQEQSTFSYGWSQAFSKYKDDATNASKIAGDLFDKTSKGMEDAIVNFAKTGKLNFGDFAASVISDLARIAARKAVMGMFSMFGLKDGGAFDQPGVKAFAKGDVFNSPTNFSYSGGLGQLGEAGPESVMPLKRNASGQLGVIAQGGGGGTTQNISIAVTVQGGNTNAETGNAVAMKIQEQFTRGIVKQELMAAKRTGGMLNPI